MYVLFVVGCLHREQLFLPNDSSTPGVRAEILSYHRELQIMWSPTETGNTITTAINQGKALRTEPINALQYITGTAAVLLQAAVLLPWDTFSKYKFFVFRQNKIRMSKRYYMSARESMGHMFCMKYPRSGVRQHSKNNLFEKTFSNHGIPLRGLTTLVLSSPSCPFFFVLIVMQYTPEPPRGT